MNCDFEQDFCMWEVKKFPNSNSNSYVWARNSGQTPSSGTGPEKDHTKGDLNGKYVFVEASQRNSGYYTDLISEYFNLNNEDYCLELYFHMFGSLSDMGKLEVLGFKGGYKRKNYFESLTNKGRNWNQLTIDLKSSDDIDQVSLTSN